jgi:hypothetical protein
MAGARQPLIQGSASADVRDALAPPEDLLVLERGADEILLCHPVALRPVYLRRGRAFVKELLLRVGSGIDRKSLYAAYHDDRDLLSLLERSRILQPPGPAPRVPPAHGTCPSHDRIVTYLTVTTPAT